MAVCAEYRVPHSGFLSWSADDRAKAIWWLIRQRETCQSCGTRPSEWDEDEGGYRFAYRAEIHQCEGCLIRQRAEESPEFTESGLRGLKVVLAKNERIYGNL